MRLVLIILAVLASSVARAETYFYITSTPDHTVGASATAEVLFRRVGDWVYIRNHCSDDVYFAINPPRGLSDTNGFPIRLAQDEVFVVPVRVYSVGASASGTSSCTFTAITGGK